MLTFVAIDLATRRIQNSSTKGIETHPDLGGKDYYVCDQGPKIQELWAWPHSLSSVTFFTEIKPKEEKVFFISP